MLVQLYERISAPKGLVGILKDNYMQVKTSGFWKYYIMLKNFIYLPWFPLVRNDEIVYKENEVSVKTS